MARKKLTPEQVASERTVNTPVIFNLQAALKKVAEMPAASTKSGALGQLSKNILDIVRGAGTPVSIAQVHAALLAGGLEVTRKKVSDKLWELTFKAKLISKAGHGVYSGEAPESIVLDGADELD